ncbi:ketoacyl-ACP synthase III family protein [Streptomyces beijiangensis]|uniref:Ketoacyl-ACP synthase III family protein n=1 Tax=Streptomyces beijiangensis TaxID=163361 RepID=A0A939JFD0_9ACTN|nr:ketoacyl-ACP synthase III family protein [Streptomyces beijiangensis]MBO0512268.1 ketoacyl-ACP synthase III family protein [Streptomyces beijiangensis]
MIPGQVWLSPAQWLPRTAEKTVDALAEGRVTDGEADAMGYEQLPVSSDESAPQMAVRAARRALSLAGTPAESIAATLHAWTYYQGHDFWSPAHYVAAGSGALHSIPTGIQQMCNGAAAALQSAVHHVTADASGAPVLVTTADRFAPPGFDRWGGDYGVWYGDGATAAVVGRATGTDAVPEGSLTLRALQTRAAPELETAHRDVDTFHAAPHTAGPAVDVRRAKKAFLATQGKAEFLGRLRRETSEVLAAALREAGIGPGGQELHSVLLPRLGRATAREVYGPAVAEVTGAPVADLGERTGHLGAGDLLSNLTALSAGASPYRLQRGQYAAVLSAGAGFTWSAVVVHRP